MGLLVIYLLTGWLYSALAVAAKLTNNGSVSAIHFGSGPVSRKK
jgi:hypothetical protein